MRQWCLLAAMLLYGCRDTPMAIPLPPIFTSASPPPILAMPTPTPIPPTTSPLPTPTPVPSNLGPACEESRRTTVHGLILDEENQPVTGIVLTATVSGATFANASDTIMVGSQENRWMIHGVPIGHAMTIRTAPSGYTPATVAIVPKGNSADGLTDNPCRPTAPTTNQVDIRLTKTP